MESQFFDYLQKIPIIKSLLSNTSLLVGIGAGLTVLLLAVFIRTLFYIWNYAIRSASQQTGTTSDDTNDWDWFGPNKAKIQYQECLVNTPENTGDLKKLLRERALEIVRRIRKVEEEKEALGKLYKNGSISQTMWESLKRAEKNAQLEIFEIQAEADTFEKGWGEAILREANGVMAENDQVNAVLKELKKADPSLKIPESEEARKMLAKRIIQEMKRKGGAHR